MVFATVVLVALLGTLDDFKESKPDIEWKVWTFQVEKKFHWWTGRPTVAGQSGGKRTRRAGDQGGKAGAG